MAKDNGLGVIAVRIEGATPLLMHCKNLLSDRCSWVKAEMDKISKKRNRTVEEEWALRRLEFIGGSYVDSDGELCIPADNMRALIRDGLRMRKLGKQIAAVAVRDVAFEHDGPETPEKLWEFKTPETANPFIFVTGASQGIRNTVQRTRPRFDKWACTFTIDYRRCDVSEDDIKDALEIAGRLIGLGDWHGTFGKFSIEKWQVK